MQDVIPMLSYENGIEALEWLKSAFGFEENIEMRMIEDGRLTHAELKINDNIIMIATPTPDYESINKQRKNYKQMDKWLSVPWVVNGLLVYVKDVEPHFKKAKENGAEILSEIGEGFPGKRYRCADVEGHRWMFMEK
ncbi:MAG: VOC family protein [Bacteroidota bacterium]|nr:VOC family protein [Bacteroidota bacterium]